MSRLKRLPGVSYLGGSLYFLTFCVRDRLDVFVNADAVSSALRQIQHVARTRQFTILAYCFMPDHLHLIASGTAENADVKKLIARAKQYSGFNFKQEFGLCLWQRYGFERVIRDDMELACTIGYVVANPVRAGLASHPLMYPHLGSTQFQVAELLEICEYGRLTHPSG